MAIYLDTGVFCRWRNFDGADRLALSIAAGQLDQRIVVPELAMNEAIAHRKRELESVLKRFSIAEQDLKVHFALEDVHSEPSPDVGRRLADWRRSLEGFCDIVPTVDSHTARAMLYEIDGRAPAKARTDNKNPGAGARDAAIWLAALHDHRMRGEPGFFVTTNSKDFFEGDEPRPELVSDGADFPHPLTVKLRPSGLLEAIGTSESDVSVDQKSITKSTFEAIQRGLREDFTVPLAVFMESAGHRFRTTVKRGDLKRIISAKRFSRGEERLLVLDSEWHLWADCLFQDSAAPNNGPWGTIPDVWLHGRIQVYLPENGSETVNGDLIAARLRADKVVFFEDGEPVILNDPGFETRVFGLPIT